MSIKDGREKEIMFAIYRLQFYKNKKDWKLSKDVRKKCEGAQKSKSEVEKKPLKDTRCQLNKTYNIEKGPETASDEISALNNAFFETDLETPPADVHKKDLLPDLAPDLKTGNSWHNDGDPVPQDQDHHQDNQHEDWSVPDRPWTEYEQDNAWQMLAHQYWQNIPPQQYVEMAHQYYSSSNANYEGWQTNNAWVQNAEYNNLPEPQGDACDGPLHPELLRNEADDAVLQSYDWQATDLADDEEVSLETFMRGAAAVPHSSEVELRRCNVSESGISVSELTSQQLMADAAQHAQALSELLNEVRCRQIAQSQSLEHPSWDEPTRDPGPFTPVPPLQQQISPLQRQETFVKDPIVAGSFNITDVGFAGRGRGRLRSRPGVLGTGLGRGRLNLLRNF